MKFFMDKIFIVLGVSFLLLSSLTLAPCDTAIEVKQDVGVTLYFDGYPTTIQSKSGKYEPLLCFDNKYYISSEGIKQLFGFTMTDCGTSLEFREIRFEPKSIMHTLENYTDRENVRDLWRGITKSFNTTATMLSKRVKFADGIFINLDVIKLNSEYYFPLRDICNKFGYEIDYNKDLDGIDVMSPHFYKIIRDFITTDSDRIFIGSLDPKRVRYYIQANIFKDSSNIYSWKMGTDKEKGTYLRVFKDSIDDILSDREYIEQEIRDIYVGLKIDNLPAESKVQRINDWICDTYVYDKSGYSETNDISPRTFKEILNTNNQVCEGYARMFVALCKEAGLNAQYLTGYVNNLGNHVCHAWCRVYIGDEWLYCDPTLSDSLPKRESALLKTEAEMVAIHQEYSIAIRF